MNLRSFLKKSLLGISIAIGCALVLSVVFYLWASSARLTGEEYASGNLYVDEDAADESADNEYTIVTYNVGYASGLSNNSGDNASESEYSENLELIVAALRSVDPDLVAFQEIDYGSSRSHHQKQLRAISDGLGLKYRAQAFNWDVNYLPFPYWPPSEHFGRVLSGQAIASAFPVLDQSKVTLAIPVEQPFYYNKFYLDRIVQIVELEIGGQTLTLLNVHLEAYMKGTREKQSLEVVDVVRKYNDGPLILIGDFNAAPAWFQRESENINEDVSTELRSDDTIANILEQTSLKIAIPEDTYDGGHMDAHNTFRSDSPSAPIDHIFYNDYIENLSARVIAEAGTGSDHLPLMMTFSIN